MQIIFPKPVHKLRANPEYIDRARARTRSKILVGNLTGKHMAGSLGGAAATIAVPNAMRLKGWSDVMPNGAVSIGGGIAVKQMDEGAGDAFMLTGLDVTSFKAVKQLMRTAKGKPPGDEEGDPTGEAWEMMSSMAWMISESMVLALMTSARMSSWVTKMTCWTSEISLISAKK